MSAILELELLSTDNKILVCRGCLATDTELHDINENDIALHFSNFIGFYVHQSDGYPQFVCSTCLFLLRKFVGFRRKCLTAMQALQQMKLSGHIITTAFIKSIDRSQIKHDYQIQNVFDFEKNSIEQNDDRNLFDVAHTKFDNTFDEAISDNEDIKVETSNLVKCQIPQLHTENDLLVVKEEVIKSQDNFTLHDIKVSNIAHSKPCIKEESKTIRKKFHKKIEQEHNYSKSNVTRNNDVDNKRKKRTIIKKTQKQEANITEETGGADEELNEEWQTIIKEMKDEQSANRLTQRKVLSKKCVQSLINKAKTFATTNNVEVKFLTKEEQKIEIEEKRNSEKFKNATYKCDKCCRVFQKQETFDNHVILNHSEGDYVCDICLYSFRTRAKYLFHYDHVHVRKVTCKECGQINRGWTTAREHFLWHQGKNGIIKCEQCDLQFTLRKKYLSHVLNTHGGGVNGPQCLVCERAFYSQKGLEVHLLKTHKDKPHCSSCGAVFVSTEALGVHVNAPQGCQPGHSCCPKCGNTFSNESELKSHYKEKHSNHEYQCEKCRKSFTVLLKYQTHLRHHLRRVRQSSACNRAPRREKSYPDEKTVYVCEVCGVEKQCMALLLEHQRLHTGETPYQCDFCPKTFRLKSTLKSHIATHTGEKSYECKICHKAFRQRAHLKVHMVIHTKERPCPCELCPKTYTNTSNLREHVRTAHLGQPPRKRMKKAV